MLIGKKLRESTLWVALPTVLVIVFTATATNGQPVSPKPVSPTPVSPKLIPSANVVTPQWTIEHFDGDINCNALDKVREGGNAALWKRVDAAQPVERPLRLWIRVRSDERLTFEPGWLASVDRTRVNNFWFNLAQGAGMQRRNALEPVRPYEFSSQAVAIALPPSLDPRAPWYFCLAVGQGLSVSSAALALQAAPSFREADLFAAQRTAACIAVILTMMLSAAFFGARLRDDVYLWYVGHVAGFVAFQATVTGLMSRWLDFMTEGYRWAWIGQIAGIGVSVCCASYFISTFLSLTQVLPRTDRWLRRVAQSILAASLLLVVFGAASLQRVDAPFVLYVFGMGIYVQNGLTAIACVIVLWACAFLAIKRHRFALYLVVGWMPLLVVSILTAVEIGTSVTNRVWGAWLLPAAAFEALVLSLGMAARTLDLRNERDAARISAEIDPLTGALNRRGLFNRLEPMQADAVTSKQSHALLYCDLDWFKRINDQHGHEAGDACLQHFVACAQSVLRKVDVIGRIGGEEFVLLLKAQNVAQALAVGERLRTKLQATPARWRETPIPLTVSIGVALIDAQTSPTGALSKADTALYRAKAEGRDRVCVG